MKVIVTGATGFVGSGVVAKLRERGDTIIALSRNAAKAKVALGVEAVTADLETPGPWGEALRGADVVVHLAGEPIAGKRWSARQKQVIRDSRVEATRTLVEMIAALPPAERPRVLVHASGADYYPFAPDAEFDDDEYVETDAPGDSFLARVCRDWEKEAREALPLGVRVCAMRLGVVLGEGGGALSKMTTPFKLFVGGRLGGGRQWLAWIHRDDAVAAFVAAVHDARYEGPLNLVAGSVRNAELSRELGKSLGRPSWLPVPAFALKMAVGEVSEYLLQGRNVVPKRLRELGFTWRHPELRAALRA